MTPGPARTGVVFPMCERCDQRVAIKTDARGRYLCVSCATPKGEPLVGPSTVLGRNDPCHCRSGKKYKRCHGVRDVLSEGK